MASTLDTNSSLSSVWLLILMLVSFCASPLQARWEKLRGLPVVDVRTNYFSPDELKYLVTEFGLKKGQPINERRLDDAIRKVYQSGRVQSVLIEAEPKGNGIVVWLKGTRLRKIRKIEFNNVESGMLFDLKARMSLKSGDDANFRTLGRLRDKLREIYAENGYYGADVQILLNDLDNGREADVQVNVQPGLQTVIVDVRVAGGNQEENENMQDEISLRVGDTFTRERLDKAVAEINEYLKENQFLTSKVEETTLDFFEEKSQVKLTIFVKLGNRYQFEFDGNTVFYEPQLRELMTPEILSQVNAAQRIAELVEEKYKSVGYHFCRVTVQEERLVEDQVKVIRFKVDEGERVLIDRLDIVGDTQVISGRGVLSARDLRKLFYKVSPGVIRERAYWEQGLKEATRNFEKELVKFGYLNSSASVQKTNFNQDQLGVRLVIEVELGTRTVVSGIQFKGNQKYSDDELRELLPFGAGDPLSREQVKEGRNILAEFYRDRGYLDVKVEGTNEQGLEASRGQENVLIETKITEGPQYRIGKITVEGNKQTKDRVILRELEVAEGDVYNPKKVRESEEAITLLGLFARVRIIPTVDKNQPRVKGLRIVVDESEPGSGEIGFGATFTDPFFRLRTFLGLGYRNVLGLNHTTTFRGEVALPISGSRFVDFIEYASIVGYRAPYPFELPLIFSTQLGVDNFLVATDPNLFQQRFTYEAKVEKRFTDELLGIYRIYSLERTVTTLDDGGTGTTTEDGKEIAIIGSTGPGLIIDFRDDAFNPKLGSYHTIDFEFASPVLGSSKDSQDIEFILLLSRNSFYIPLFSPFSLVAFAGGGYADSLRPETGGEGGIPEARLLSDMSLGGPGSIRGFNVRHFKPHDANNDGIASQEIYKAAFYNFRLELWTKLAEKLSVVTFFDTGQVYRLSPHRSFPRGDGVGFGFRYETPVGPVAVDIGVGLNKGEQARFYFTVGSL